jgi:hypothetical protein
MRDSLLTFRAARTRLFAKKFNSLDSTATLNFFNCRPVPPNAYRVLFIGDSLTIHGRTAKLWDHFSGMAASTPEKDFVHIFTSHLQQSAKQPVEIFYNNGGNGKIGSMLHYLKTCPALRPNLAVIQGGENDKFDDTFRSIYPELVGFYACPRIILGDWLSEEKSEFGSMCAASLGVPFVNMFDIAKNPLNSGDGGPYNLPDVALHPNDSGMAAIAHALMERFENLAISDLASTEQ